MKPTRIPVLVAVAVLVGVVSYLFAGTYYGQLPGLPGYTPATLVVLAVGEGSAAFNIRARLHGRQRPTRPVNPLAVARAAALAKASSLVGAVALGAYTGLVIHLAGRLEVRQIAHDALVAGASAGAGLLLVAAALWLEWACRVPKPPDEEKKRDHAAEPPHAESGH